MRLFGWWLLEQAVWVAPLAAAGLCLAAPHLLRSPLAAALAYGLLVLFGLNLIGLFPGAARVSCVFDRGPVCTERTTGADRVGDERRPGQGSSSLSTPVPAVGVGVRGGSSTPPYVGPPAVGRPTPAGTTAAESVPALTPAGTIPRPAAVPAGVLRIRAAGMERGSVGVEAPQHGHHGLGPVRAAVGLNIRGRPAAALACGGVR